MQTRLKTKRNLRLDRRRQCKRTRFDRTFDQSDQSNVVIPVLADLNQKDLTALADLMEAGKVTPVIDRTYKLSELPQAIQYLEQGHARGKVVIAVD